MQSLRKYERVIQFVFLLIVAFGINRYINHEAANVFVLCLIAINLISIKLAIYQFLGKTEPL